MGYSLSTFSSKMNSITVIVALCVALCEGRLVDYDDLIDMGWDIDLYSTKLDWCWDRYFAVGLDRQNPGVIEFPGEGESGLINRGGCNIFGEWFPVDHKDVTHRVINEKGDERCCRCKSARWSRIVCWPVHQFKGAKENCPARKFEKEVSWMKKLN